MQRPLSRFPQFVTFTLLAATLAGCTLVKPWERDLHARPDMQPNSLDIAIDEHIYFSKEASSGGRGFGGGGCGCN
jgi:hypothetical protein